MRIVQRSRRIAPRTPCASSGLGWYTALMPPSSGNHTVTVMPNEWKNGRMPQKRSEGSVISEMRIDSTCERMLWCESITPLGSPVEPDEKSSWKSPSGFGRPACAMPPA